MSNVQRANAIVDYLKSIHPRVATKKEILAAIKMPDCSCDRALKTLRSRQHVIVSGKRGNSNLYKYNPS